MARASQPSPRPHKVSSASSNRGYLVDFVCLDAKLIVEIDGSQHADSNYDEARSTNLRAQGFRVLRFWNDDVLKDINSVCDTVIAYARDVALHPWR